MGFLIPLERGSTESRNEIAAKDTVLPGQEYPL